MSPGMSAEHCSPDHDTRLPAYLSRHMRLGFDSDDVAALINSIDSSQDPQSSELSHLPAEILFQIVEFVPVNHILTWRLVCRGFRDAIDGPVQYGHLRRAELIGYVGPHAQYPLSQLSESSYEEIKLVRAHFDRTDGTHTFEAHAPAKWSYDQAIFTIEDAWYQGLARIEHQTTKDGVMRPAWQSLLDDLQLLGDEESHYGTLTWCLRLDKAVMDLEFSPETLRECIAIDLVNKRIMVQWKSLFLNFLKTETRLRLLMGEASVHCNFSPSVSTCQPIKQNCNAPFTFDLQQDCLRAVRRERLRAILDLDIKAHRLINWEINMLRPLFGRPRYDQASQGFIGLETIENDATAILSLLRKEANMSCREAAYLEQLSADRKKMERDLQGMSKTFGDWKSMLFGVNAQHNGTSTLPGVPRNPVAWTEEVRAREEERIKTWQSQRKLVGQLALLFNASIEAMSLPDGAFDDSEGDL